ncbi:MAG TPA: hypothetical protein DEP05_04210, partial [Betaproteobacteria bacterium]|nr:hypothetical protein [Betaproteobacteria bacterium]
KPFIPGDVKRFENMLINSRAIFAQPLGAPVIMANRVGPLETELPGHLPYLKSSFPGLSSIVDADGAVKKALGNEEGVIVADVSIGRKITHPRAPKRYGKTWGVPVPWYTFIWPLTRKTGERRYAANPLRKKHALAVSRGVKALP